MHPVVDVCSSETRPEAFIDGKDYYCFSGRDEVYYCVRVSDLDETIYKLDLEWSKPPVPFASDIYHYFALRYFRQDDD